ncbi:glutaredoxin 3 [uncultured Ilyobacter sp.]|uniref:glutaredoxin 3 n=1 Tax=uncultured Ilyobacter sp. TaxID=544433 RepID=UPI0029C0F514|nr:glutaredoxin 3 [uncultured Ilyobacter sp.]
MKKEITIYIKKTCPYCIRAKMLLDSKKVNYTEIDIEEHPEQREVMITRSNGRKTVPQIFIDEFHVGGCDDLFALDNSKRLDSLLNPSDTREEI